MLKNSKSTNMQLTLTTVMVMLLLLCQAPLTAHEGSPGASNGGAGEFQDFPAMCVNGKGEAIVAYIDRPVNAEPRLIVAAHHDG
jgi:hypothetical protein